MAVQPTRPTQGNRVRYKNIILRKDEVLKQINKLSNRVQQAIYAINVFIFLGATFLLAAGLSVAGLVTVLNAAACISLSLLFVSAAVLCSTYVLELFESQKTHYLQYYRDIQMTRPQLIQKERPVGLRNVAFNCWANSMLQMLFNIPVFVETLKALPEDHEYAFLKTIYTKYEENTRQTPNFVSEIDTQLLREHLNALNSQNISRSPYRQEDVTEAIKLFEALLPSYKIEKEKIYSYENNNPVNPDQEVGNNRVLEISAENNQFSVKTELDENMIPLDMSNLGDEVTLNALIERSLETAHNGAITSKFINQNNEEKYYPLMTERSQIKGAPNDVIFSLNRFIYEPKTDKDGNYVNDKNGRIVTIQRKVNTKVVAPETIEINNETYTLRNIIRHIGPTTLRGHYQAFTKKEGAWYKCNDAKVVERTFQEVAQETANSGYVYHYEKLQ